MRKRKILKRQSPMCLSLLSAILLIKSPICGIKHKRWHTSGGDMAKISFADPMLIRGRYRASAGAILGFTQGDSVIRDRTFR